MPIQANTHRSNICFWFKYFHIHTYMDKRKATIIFKSHCVRIVIMNYYKFFCDLLLIFADKSET